MARLQPACQADAGLSRRGPPLPRRTTRQILPPRPNLPLQAGRRCPLPVPPAASQFQPVRHRGPSDLHSLKFRLVALWVLSLLASAAVALLLQQLYRQSTEAQLARAQAVAARGCDLIRGSYDFYTTGWTGPVPPLTDPQLRASLKAVVTLALLRQSGVQGGIWQADAGSLAFAFPSAPPPAQAGLPQAGLPQAEAAEIAAVNHEAEQDELPADRRLSNWSRTLMLHACPLPGPIPNLTGWTMALVPAAPALGPLPLGLAVLLGLVLLMSGGIGWTLLVWARHVKAIEAALATGGSAGMPQVPPTGERELDRIISALNEAGHRLAAARRESEAMVQRMARSERLAGLGRVAAGVAHEIRNPIAAARLQGENALAGDDARRRQAVADMLTQLARLDALVGELLDMTQRVDPQPAPVPLAGFLAECAARYAAAAAARGVHIAVAAEDAPAWLDARIVGRVIDNLLSNAVRHAPEHGWVTLSAMRTPDRLAVLVEDSGIGIAPELADTLFEPFVTGRANGTGLGLAIARELAQAHGGTLSLRRPGGGQPGQGAVFALELPQEAPCRRS